MSSELLAPAGTLEKLKFAVEFGADAVYFGVGFSLRSFAGNFNIEEAEEGLKYLHERGKKGYITLNIYPFTEEIKDIKKLVGELDSIGADAFIVSDMGVLFELKSMGLNAKLHISTQANTTNASAVLAYGEVGASRVNLAREMSLEQIQKIQGKVLGSGIETEVFVHGAVCFSYSGRCAISDYMTGRRANRGECTHPCRWKYHLVEEQRPGDYYPVYEDERGLYLFNSKDLALFEYIPALQEAGVNSFKLEGRMKSIHYVASVVSLYRRIIDGEKVSEEEIFSLLSRVRNRGYSQGFMKGSVEPEDYRTGENESLGLETVFVGNVLDEFANGKQLFRVRNKVLPGDRLEVLRPDGKIVEICLPDILLNEKNYELEAGNNEAKIQLSENLPPYSIIRRVNI